MLCVPISKILLEFLYKPLIGVIENSNRVSKTSRILVEFLYRPQAEVDENSSRINRTNIRGTHIHTWFMLGPTSEKHEVLKTKNQEDFPSTQQITKDITKMWIFSSAECKQFWKVIICNKAEIY